MSVGEYPGLSLARAVCAGAVRAVPRQPTRPQELAMDAMHAKHGRYTARFQADGSVVITGLLDDIERETVCVAPDGTERWRS